MQWWRWEQSAKNTEAYKRRKIWVQGKGEGQEGKVFSKKTLHALSEWLWGLRDGRAQGGQWALGS